MDAKNRQVPVLMDPKNRRAVVERYYVDTQEMDPQFLEAAAWPVQT